MYAGVPYRRDNVAYTQLPQCADEFRRIRRAYGLAESPILRIMERNGTIPSTTAGNAIRRTQTSNAASPSSYRSSLQPASSLHARRASEQNLTRQRSNLTTRTAPVPVTVHQGPEEEGAPPPPYAAADPSPEATRLLQERLAAEAEAQNQIAAQDPMPPAASGAAGAGAASAQPVTVHPVQSGSEREMSIDSAPSDVDLRRVWEESQIDEAERRSRAAERERLELEEALRLSMADVPGSSGGFEDPAGFGIGQDSSNHTGTNVGGVTSSFDNLNMNHDYRPDVKEPFLQPSQTNNAAPAAPSGWGTHTPVPNPGPQTAVNLLDDGDMMSSAPTLIPTRTGPAIGSKNPFLSGAEQDEAQSTSNNLSVPSSPQTPLARQVSGALATPSPRQSFHESPGSNRTTYSVAPGSSPVPRALPHPPTSSAVTIPTPQTFAPPSTPPPPHLRVATGGVTIPPLPPRRDTAATPTGPAPPVIVHQSGEDPLEMLREYDTVFLGKSSYCQFHQLTHLSR